MVVIAISATLAGMGAYAAMQELPLFQLKRAARVLMGQMQQARLNAIKEDRPWQIVFNQAANTYQLIDSGPDSTLGTADDIPEPLVSLSSFGKISYGAGAATATWSNGAITQQTSVTFTSRGLCGPGSTFLTNQNNSISFAITTSMSGGISLRKYNGILPFNPNNWMN